MSKEHSHDNTSKRPAKKRLPGFIPWEVLDALQLAHDRKVLTGEIYEPQPVGKFKRHGHRAKRG